MYVYFLMDPDAGFVQKLRHKPDNRLLAMSWMAFEFKEEYGEYLMNKNRITGQTGYLVDEDMVELYDQRMRLTSLIEDKEKWLTKPAT